jgi:glycosyltransferase involved in cell wall biosynthesis
MDFSVILCTYNRADSLGMTLDTFSRLKIPAKLRWELLVVDNNSCDSTREVIQRFAETSTLPVRYVFEKRQGRSAAMNTGIGESSGEIIAFTDDDVLLHPDWLGQVKKVFEQFDCAAVAGRVVPQWNQPKPEWLKMEGQQAIVNFELGDEFKEVPFPLGANSAFRRNVFQRHGLFRLDLGVSGSKHTVTCEDTEFGMRLAKVGEKVIYCPTAIIYHPVDPRRATKKYFLSWYFYDGVSVTRTAGLPGFGVRYLGVPRWLYRECLQNFGRWMLSVDGNNRFQLKLKTYRSIGAIVESCRLSRLKAAGSRSRLERA